jgi:hypothetical protein
LWAPYKADTMGADFKQRGLTNRANTEAKHIAPIDRHWRIWMMADLDQLPAQP